MTLVIKEVVIRELIKWLDTGIVYPISDSGLEEGGITVETNDNNKLILTRIVIEWIICMDYRKLNYATLKDYYPIIFID